MTYRSCCTWSHAAALGAALALGVTGSAGTPAAGAGATPALWVRATAEAAAATLLHLQPGFATMLRANRRIDTVAIGDPRMVTATAVRRGQDAFDLVLQPQVETGMTNMVVWYGELATVWRLEIGPGPRTADIVHVVTAAAAGAPRPQAGASPAPPAPTPPASTPPAATPPASIPPAPTPPTLTSPAGRAALEPAPGAGAAPDLPASGRRPPTDPPMAGGVATRELPEPPAAPLRAGSPEKPVPVDAAPAQLEVRQAVGEVTAVFQAIRIADGVMIRYRITNGSRSDLAFRPGSVLVKVNGRIVPYGMARASTDRGRPGILPRGATETGVIDAPGGAPRTIRLILSLFPAGPPADQAEETALPVTFQPAFNEVDRLVISSVR